jgi:hypothetical protein
MIGQTSLSASATDLPGARTCRFRSAITTLRLCSSMAVAAVQKLIPNRRQAGLWKSDFPSNVGLDHLARVGYHPWIPRA